jgi:PTH2 family peptidyl-tRNA hydrolase
MADTTQQPSTANIAAACAILAGVTGYMLGQAKSLGLFGGSPVFQPTKSEKEKAEDLEDSEDDSSDEDDDSAPAEFPGHTEECKMVLVVRTDLGMTKGIAILDTWPLSRKCLTMQ